MVKTIGKPLMANLKSRPAKFPFSCLLLAFFFIFLKNSHRLLIIFLFYEVLRSWSFFGRFRAVEVPPTTGTTDQNVFVIGSNTFKGCKSQNKATVALAAANKIRPAPEGPGFATMTLRELVFSYL